MNRVYNSVDRATQSNISCVKVEVAVLGSLYLTVLTVSVDV